MLILLIVIFAGFAYMHYYSIGGIHFVNANIPETLKEISKSNNRIDVIQLFQEIVSDNDRATSRVFALVTVLIAASTLIVALQFIVNVRAMQEIERKGEELEKEFAEKKSKISRIEHAINKVESLAQATSYPLVISTDNIKKELIKDVEEYRKNIEYAFEGYDKDNIKDRADWKKILFYTQQALYSFSQRRVQNNELKENLNRFIAIAACKSEEYTGDREEKSILLSLAIDSFSSIQNKDNVDNVNLASSYARRGMLYTFLPKSYDYEQADRLFECTIMSMLRDKRKKINLIQTAYFNWGVSWLARTSILKQDTKEWVFFHIDAAKKNAKKYLEKANKANKESDMAAYALLTLYSISGDIKEFIKLIDYLDSKFRNQEEPIRLPSLHRIYEDIDLDFIKNENKAIYERLITLTEANDERKREYNDSDQKSLYIECPNRLTTCFNRVRQKFLC